MFESSFKFPMGKVGWKGELAVLLHHHSLNFPPKVLKTHFARNITGELVSPFHHHWIRTPKFIIQRNHTIFLKFWHCLSKILMYSCNVTYYKKTKHNAKVKLLEYLVILVQSGKRSQGNQGQGFLIKQVKSTILKLL